MSLDPEESVYHEHGAWGVCRFKCLESGESVHLIAWTLENLPIQEPGA